MGATIYEVDTWHVPMLSNPKLVIGDPYRRKRLTGGIFTQQGVELEQPPRTFVLQKFFFRQLRSIGGSNFPSAF